MQSKHLKKNDLKFYDLSADRWWQEDEKIYALYHLNQPRFDFFDRYVSNWQGLQALDVGCGGGFTCEFMAKRGVKVSGIDQSAKCIQQAQDHASLSGLQIDYQQGYSENLPYSANTFDIVVCVDVLEHIADLRQTLSEIYRILKPNGLFLFDTINKTFASKLIMIWLLENILQEIPRGIHDWNKFIEPQELTSLMHSQGFNSIEIKGFNIFGESIYQNVLAYIHYKKTGKFQVGISNNTSVMYIGKAIKLPK
ncbi:bifunctional 2-polyprenyl-6-hydroxyphenol methylase/3-demethylubiquinol 3-O-methyltransferase UbiG [Coleofasciculus sp. FACHB-SPT36]|uniref:bifunctional 2-polyprenyl-6-hydroxyphenol methylase/3-demethylubiquinol 3-O-methyltransferase UbiG n=2 Tax=Cyanophyceae TaxID=3028117 RepID=UPI00168A7448|nr:bifunctional 2-polyprenyl-6-hydroxyphenol methylase/3-demethylubiquinol 3-O-methyltransferase UbiG [Coleofasciculus sp. FACHB-SPT36]MBD2539470.1 3-demethylubiquinone-9 3-O-methyltransferase [Coleofasciculus sp. FACHB-SPT36]